MNVYYFNRYLGAALRLLPVLAWPGSQFSAARVMRLVVYGKDEGFCGDGGAVEAFADCFVGGGRLLGQIGDLRDGLIVNRGPG
jgi:hypothetical protein